MCVYVCGEKVGVSLRLCVCGGEHIWMYSCVQYRDATLVEWAQKQGLAVGVYVGILVAEIVSHRQQKLLLRAVLFVGDGTLGHVHLLDLFWAARYEEGH